MTNNNKNKYWSGFFRGIIVALVAGVILFYFQYWVTKPSITQIESLQAEIYVGEEYTFPDTIKALMSDGTERSFPINWNNNLIDTSKASNHLFEGEVNGYQDKVILKVFVKSPYEDEYKKIEQLNTGMHYKYVDSIFGTPTVVDSVKDKYIERAYFFKEFIVYTIAAENGSIVYYSVTIKDPEFNPPVPPFGDFKLGKFKLSDIGYIPDNFHHDMSSKFMEYHETFYFGNPGYYKNYNYGYSPSGCILGDEDNLIDIIKILNKYYDFKLNRYNLMDFKGDEDYNKYIELRGSVTPNTFGVIGFVDDEIEEFLMNYITIDFFTAREYF